VFGAENWSVIPLGGGFMLVNRANRHVPEAVLKKIEQLLESPGANHEANEPVSLN
jgi:hypothetical protein